MASRCASVLFIFLSVVVAWVAAVPVQAGANTLRRDFYGPATTEYLGGYLDDHGSSRDEDHGWDRSRYIGGGSSKGSISSPPVSQERSLHSRSENELDGDDRSDRNLDQIGGGNLLRREMTQRWLGTRANLDQIGGGNLVRNLDQIGGGNLVRNLDQIGGGNLVRNLDQIGGGNLVRNLDQIGGGNLVRNLDQIGGGNLVRNLDQIGGGNLVRNLDQIGGGNLVRSYKDMVTATHNFQRNLDQIGGGNLVRGLSERVATRDVEKEPHDTDS